MSYFYGTVWYEWRYVELLGEKMMVKDRVLSILLVTAIGISATGCGKQKEPEVKKIIGIEYDNTDQPTEENIEETTETKTTETVEKKGISGEGLAGLEDLQKEFNIDDTEKTLSQSITDIPNYLANYIAQYYTKEGIVLEKYKVINSDKMIITKAKDKDNLLLFSLSKYKDTSKAVVNISELANGKLYLYKDYLVSVKKGLVKGIIYVGEDNPTIRSEDIGAKSVLSKGEKIDF